MTDPLSATAAAAGFIGLAGQIANGIVKLHSFYKTVKSAPKQVSEILDAMQGVQGALEATGEMLNSGSPASDLARRSTEACLAQCKRLQESLYDKLRRLEKRFQNPTPWSSSVSGIHARHFWLSSLIFPDAKDPYRLLRLLPNPTMTSLALRSLRTTVSFQNVSPRHCNS